jgi:hypothetical protein
MGSLRLLFVAPARGFCIAITLMPALKTSLACRSKLLAAERTEVRSMLVSTR